MIRYRATVQIPETFSFQTKPQIAWELIDWALQQGVPIEGVGADTAYGGNPMFLEGLMREGGCVVAVPSSFGVRSSDATFQPTYEGAGSSSHSSSVGSAENSQRGPRPSVSGMLTVDYVGGRVP